MVDIEARFSALPDATPANEPVHAANADVVPANELVLAPSVREVRAANAAKGRPSRLQEAVSKRLAPLAKGYDAVAACWRKLHGLRKGDHLQSSAQLIEGKRRKKKVQGDREHVNRWGFEDAVRFAFKTFKRCCPDSNSKKMNIGESNRSLNTVAAVSALHGLAQSVKINELHELIKSGQAQGLIITNGWDCTPSFLKFGQLTEVVAPRARYLVKAEVENGRHVWKAVSAEAFKELGKRALPHSGVLELMAQRTALHVINRDCTYREQEVIVPPRVLQNGKSSTLLEATDKNGFNIASLNAMAEHCYTILSENPDKASSNRRLMAFKGVSLSNKVLYDKSFCSVHGVHRIVSKASGEKELCRNLRCAHNS